MPHLVAIAAAATGPIEPSFFQLLARKGHAPALPEDLAAPYRAALHDMHRVAFPYADDTWDRSMVLAVATALVAIKGDAKLAEALQNLDDAYVALILADDR